MGKPAEQMKEMKKVITDLEQLRDMCGTAERLSLLGSTFKRKSVISVTIDEKIKALTTAADYYKQAYKMPVNNNKTYALINWLEIEKILDQSKNKVGVKALLKNYSFINIDEFKATIEVLVGTRPDAGSDMDFWTEIGYANASLCLWLLENGKSKSINDADVFEAYKTVWKMAGSQRKSVSTMG